MEPKWAAPYIYELIEYNGNIWSVIDRNKGFTFLGRPGYNYIFESVRPEDDAKLISVLNQEFAKALYY
jgi:hypothetical protein